MPLPTFLNNHLIYYERVPYLVLDFETTNEEFGSALVPSNRIVCACWRFIEADGTITVKQAVGGELDMRELVEDVGRAAFVVAQHAKFELQWLKRCGVDLRKVLPFCTKLAAWVLDGNKKLPHGLNDLAARWIGDQKDNLVSRMIKMGIPTEDIGLKWLVKYCHKDVALTHAVFLRELRELKETNQVHLVHLRNLTCACLADIEFNGMCLDPERVGEEYSTTLAKQQELKKELDELCGGINLNSTKQLATLLYEGLGFAAPRTRWGKPLLTDSGKLPTDADTIESLKATTKQQRTFLELFKAYRKASSLLSKNLDFFQKVINERGGIFYGSFLQGSTATGRLSASGRKMEFEDGTEKGCQFQNMPRQYKKLFRARKAGGLVAECDGAQLEFRTAAGMAGDPVALQEIVDEVDIHSITAATLTAAGEPTERQEAKASTFKPLKIAA